MSTRREALRLITLALAATPFRMTSAAVRSGQLPRLFYDPTEELRAKREAQMIEDQKNKANLLKDGSANNAAVQ